MADYSGDMSDFNERQRAHEQTETEKLVNRLYNVRTRIEDAQQIVGGGSTTTLPRVTIPPSPPAPWETATPDPEREIKMDVMIIWAVNPGAEDAPWIVTAWDTETISENPEGWADELEKAESWAGGRYVRVTRTSVDYNKVQAAFQPPVV